MPDSDHPVIFHSDFIEGFVEKLAGLGIDEPDEVENYYTALVERVTADGNSN